MYPVEGDPSLDTQPGRHSSVWLLGSFGNRLLACLSGKILACFKLWRNACFSSKILASFRLWRLV